MKEGWKKTSRVLEEGWMAVPHTELIKTDRK